MNAITYATEMKLTKADLISKKLIQDDPTLIAAAQRYIKLQNRVIHPEGTFDNAKRFNLAERHACCCGIRRPSRAYPFSEMVHARGAEHVACETGVDVSALRKVANFLKKGLH